MFGKIINLILSVLGCDSGKEAKNEKKYPERVANTASCESDGSASIHRLHLYNREGIQKDKCAGKSSGSVEIEFAKEKKYSGILGAFHYMNTRAEEVNFGSSVTHEWVRGISLKVKYYCSGPQMAMLLVLLPLLYMVSPKAVVLAPLLVVLGAVALVVQSFLPVYIGLDFSLMGAVLGSVLFHPWIGVLIVFCTYVVALMLPSGHQDALEYERIFLFSFLALIIPYIPVSDVMVKCVVATYIGEFLEMVWHKYGEDYPWIMAFLKVFPRSLIYIYVFHYTLEFLV